VWIYNSPQFQKLLELIKREETQAVILSALLAAFRVSNEDHGHQQANEEFYDGAMHAVFGI
jgi:hypothetical protein